LQNRLGQNDVSATARAAIEIPVVMFCFDLLAAAGYDLRGLPLSTRNDVLRGLVPRLGVLCYAEHFEGDGQTFFDVAEELVIEGMGGKRTASNYQRGGRWRDWLKIKAHKTADVAIVGYVRGKGTRQHLGSLMMAWIKDGELVYAGNVGTGLDAQIIDALL